MIFACDPGLSGAFTLMRPTGAIVWVADMPTYTKTVGRVDRRFIAEADVLSLVQEAFMLHNAHTFVIEEVGGAPGQSAPAAFTFGYGAGIVSMAARATGMAIESVRPQEWKSALRVPKDKRASRARATELMPVHAELWPLKKHDGRAESAMLALWQVRRMQP